MRRERRIAPSFFCSMRFTALVLFAAVFGLILASGFAQTPKTITQRKASGSSKKTTAAKKTVTRSSGPTPASRKTVARGKGPVVRRSSVPRQAVPTPDRYKEIQQALVSKGYLKSEPTGAWDAASVDAMKRFQADQKQDPTGKLTAASLIDLGLGPKNNMAANPVKGLGDAVPESPRVEVAPAPQGQDNRASGPAAK